MITLHQEKPEDWWEVEALYDLCFAPGREALSSYRLREGISTVAGLSLVARDELNSVAGAIRYWPVLVGGVEALLLGPIAVHPTHQGEGLGAVLMQDSMARAKALGWARVLLVGDEPYYGRFGFSKLDDVVMPPPTNPDRVLGYELIEGAWDGIRGDVEKFDAGS
ncbi:GNAT family N-acetyltransferase [Actibacterium pelagium]|uniref:N-acetyltransferase n=1 Tax=Actibacterium pelagium TaxID=2029103 RepID=A0A917AKL4_9RHOB|nr:N-acetyltransferase [Actibacterium pelagium]GGE57683.1 N-acetyltransferase [Actibacterium pelagium]